MIVWDIWRFFDGIAKLNFDWLQGYPLREWLTGSNFNLPPLTGPALRGLGGLAVQFSGSPYRPSGRSLPTPANPMSFTLAAYLALQILLPMRH